MPIKIAIPGMVQFNGKSCKISLLHRHVKARQPAVFFRQIRAIFLKNPIELNQCPIPSVWIYLGTITDWYSLLMRDEYLIRRAPTLIYGQAK